MFSSSGWFYCSFFYRENIKSIDFFLVDSGKTGYVIDKKRIQKIREEFGRKYPDFLGKDVRKSYPSTSIVGKLYHNALNYINGKTDELETMFAQLNIDENEQKLPIQSNSVRRKDESFFR
jgi:hypothetical protein